MLMADDTSNIWSLDAASVAVDDAPNLFLDLDDFWDLMGENPEASQDSPEDLSFNNVQQGPVNLDGEPSSKAEISGSFDFSHSYHSEASESRVGVTASSSDSAGNSLIVEGVKLESSSNLGSPVNSFSGSLNDWMPPVKGPGPAQFGIDGTQYPQEDSKGTQFGMFSFESGEAQAQALAQAQAQALAQAQAQVQAHHFNDNRLTSDSVHVKHESDFQFRNLDGDTLSEYMSHKPKVPMTPNKEETSIYDASNSQYSDMYFMSEEDPMHIPSLNGQYPSYIDENIEIMEGPHLGGIDLNLHYDSGTDPYAIPNSLFQSNQDLYVVNKANESSQNSETLVIDELSTSEGCISNTTLKEENDENKRPYQHLDMFGQIARDKPPFSLPSALMKQMKKERSYIPPRVIQKIPDDDDDMCILEDISDPVHRVISTGFASEHVSFTRSYHSKALALARQKAIEERSHKANDERFVFRAALQGLSQPKAEESPPDGLLAVPLLRHQRIALCWMVKKEKYGDPCTGGILADDQGLGKTVSTIALILKERSPTSTVSAKQKEAETFDLDEECNSNLTKSVDSSVQTGSGRLAAGTLVVCPTSVLRQWNDELHNKVTKEANLSVLVYHGSNRTKDASELAKYDVVLTTYSIVSMEVPKQPLLDEDGDEIKTSSKKRKGPTSSSKRPAKGKRGLDGELIELIPAPLAKVGWFRVVLDEAQSIKNHRTQVARACWGLRAKRRWCLSGTPIQNSVDDLYSYFRFLRFDPYLKYKSFCSTIKIPIQRSPGNGYKKLQAVLKTIMLRRTKGTFLDGEPIINIPPKTIELRKVDFTDEEREFYCTLEADSRAQFAEYAAAGTVKQNYVNILLMLLRLRQACDHPLLIKGIKSKSIGTSSLEMAKKLPREKQTSLLNCLQASQAICGVCSDSPEDAVVTECEHVFCNQCISENLTGDDRQCPTTNCKVQLNTSSIFSIQTLTSSLSDNPSMESSSSSDCEVVAEKPDTFSSGYDSTKIKAALEVLEALPKPIVENEGENITIVAGEKAIVFSQWTRMLDLLESGLKNSQLQYRRLDGTMSVTARDKAVKDFNTLPEVSVMIMSLKAASLGLNMVAACHVLLLDLWWNPTTEDQAIDRAHRIGQTRPVKVVRLTVKDTVEDRILALQQKKREMVASAFGEDENGSRQSRLTVEDLKYLFGDMPR